MDNFKGKTAVITGAASGIGYALAQKAVKEGMNVVLTDINADALNDAAESLESEGAKILTYAADVAKVLHSPGLPTGNWCTV